MWHFTTPQTGWRAWSVADSDLLVFDGSGWQSWLNPLPLLGVNASADTANRLSVKSAASLFDHDGDDHRLKINKATALDTASVLIQSDYSGRAEFGLAGDDYFRIKVSPDGAAWSDALTIDPDNGNVGIQIDTPNYALEVGGLMRATSEAPDLYLTEVDQALMTAHGA